MHPCGSVAVDLLEHLVVRDVRERETLCCEAHVRPSRIFERAPVRPHAEVVGHPLVRPKRRLATARARPNVRGVDALFADQRGQEALEELPPPQRGVEAEHPDLLLDLAVPAEDGK